MSCTRTQIVAQAQKWVGLNEADGSHKKIVDVYNSQAKLPRGYKLQHTDAWCAATVSALVIACKATDIIPTECSCGKLIELLKAKGIWVEDDAYVPFPGDLIFYDWEDDGEGDNQGAPNHVGIVEAVVDGTITVIEGNYKNAVGRRVIKVNGKFIRGYGVPKYDPEVKPTPKPEVIATDYAMNFLKSFAGTYRVTASALNIRHGACVTKKKMVAIPKHSTVRCYGYYTTTFGVNWLYVQFTYKGVKYTGFASSKYLKK